jgi:hypothetical protein
MDDADQEDRRRILEARAWLRDGYTTAERVAQLMVGIRKHRGERAAEELRQEMRRQWATREQWLAESSAIDVGEQGGHGDAQA